MSRDPAWDDLDAELDGYEAALRLRVGNQNAAEALRHVRRLQRIADAADRAIAAEGGWNAMTAKQRMDSRAKSIRRAMEVCGCALISTLMSYADRAKNTRPMRHALHQGMTNDFVRYLRAKAEEQTTPEAGSPFIIPGLAGEA